MPTADAPISIALCDDHPILTEGLSTVIAIKYPQLKIRGVFHSGHDLLQNLGSLDIDILLLDLKMPGLDGVATVRQLRAERPKIRVLILTTFDDRELLLAAIHAGACGYLLKQQPVAEIVEAIQQVYCDSPIFAKQVRHKLESLLQEGADRENIALKELSRKELLCARLIAHGLSNLEIAVQMHIAEKTVRNYISNIYDKIGIHHRGEAVLWLHRHLDF